MDVHHVQYQWAPTSLRPAPQVASRTRVAVHQLDQESTHRLWPVTPSIYGSPQRWNTPIAGWLWMIYVMENPSGWWLPLWRSMTQETITKVSPTITNPLAPNIAKFAHTAANCAGLWPCRWHALVESQTSLKKTWSCIACASSLNEYLHNSLQLLTKLDHHHLHMLSLLSPWSVDSMDSMDSWFRYLRWGKDCTDYPSPRPTRSYRLAEVSQRFRERQAKYRHHIGRYTYNMNITYIHV